MSKLNPWDVNVSGMDSCHPFLSGYIAELYRLFGPEQLPLLQVGYQGMVEVDSSFMVHLASLDEYAKTVGSKTWASILHYAADVRQRKVKVAFFSATPQGGGVALMRHALVRLGHTLGVDFKW